MEKYPISGNQSEEVDLGYLFHRIGRFFGKCVKGVFMILAFFLKYIWVVAILIVLGFALGYYVDSTSKETYRNEVIVIPNFESTDYLYAKVHELNAKIRLDDEEYLQETLGPGYGNLNEVKIEPIIDIYRFVSKKEEYYDVFDILTENVEMEEFLLEMPTGKYYKYHRLIFKIKGRDPEKLIAKVLESFNANPHFSKYQEVGIENTAFRIDENEQMIQQMDSLIMSMAGYATQNASDPTVLINNTDWERFILAKQDLLDKRLELQQQRVDQVAIVKKVSASYNIVGEDAIRISRKVLYPVLLILAFGGVFFAIFLYKRMKRAAEKQ